MGDGGGDFVDCGFHNVFGLLSSMIGLVENGEKARDR